MTALGEKDTMAGKRAEEILDTYVRIGEELVLKGSISREAKKKAERPFIKIPLPVRIARHFLPLRPLIEKAVRRRSHIIKAMSSVE
jgi:hypothetical protein